MDKLDNTSTDGRVTPRLLDERAAAEWLGVSSRTLWQMRKDGKIAFIPIGKRVLYSPSDLEKFIERQRQPATAEAATAWEGPLGER